MQKQTRKDLSIAAWIVAFIVASVALADGFLPGPQGSPPADLTALNASNLTSGTVPTARFPGGAFNGASELVQLTAATKYPALDGSLITNVAAAPAGSAGGDLGSTYPNPTVTSGAHLGATTVPDAALSANIPLLNAANVFTNTSNRFTGRISVGPNDWWYLDQNSNGLRTSNVNGITSSLQNLDGTIDWMGGVFSKYCNVATAGRGIPAIYGSGRLTGQVAACVSGGGTPNPVATFTPATDGSFIVSCNVLVTTATAHSFTVTCEYTDEGNTSRVATFALNNLAGTPLTLIVNTGGAVPYEGLPMRIRAKASTPITICTAGTFTTVTYNVDGDIIQTK